MDDPAAAVSGVLVIVFPWQAFDIDAMQASLQRHLQRGGTIVLANAGKQAWEEPAIAAGLGMGHERTDEDPPLHPLRWREYASASATLSPAPGETRRPLRVAAAREWLTPPAGATVHFRDPAGRPAVFSFTRWSGRVVVVPASALSNARLGDEGNADLLESLVAAAGTEWTFDEFHHGLVPAAQAKDGTPTTRALDLVLVQLAFVYVLGLLALGRRFGPAWTEPPVVAGTTASFLRGIGALHRALGHHREASRLLVERARQMHPRERFRDPLVSEHDDAGLLRLARDIGVASPTEERTT
jgi:hypothetical protein